MPDLKFNIPLRVISESNQHEHWRKKHARKKLQQKYVYFYLKPHIDLISLPINILLTRLAPRSLDDDNLVAAFKHVRDSIADLITPGLAPGRSDNVNGIHFSYSQQKSKDYAIDILFS